MAGFIHDWNIAALTPSSPNVVGVSVYDRARDTTVLDPNSVDASMLPFTRALLKFAPIREAAKYCAVCRGTIVGVFEVVVWSWLALFCSWLELLLLIAIMFAIVD